jgi:monofunctional glycosyltransferase
VVQKDSQDGTESDAEGRTAPEQPRTEGRPAVAASPLAYDPGEILGITPTEISGDETPPPGEPIDIPAPADPGAETAGEELAPNEIVESEEFVLEDPAGGETFYLERPVEIHDTDLAPVHHGKELTREDTAATPANIEPPAPFEPVQRHEEWPRPDAPEPVATPAEFARGEAPDIQPAAATPLLAEAHAPSVPVSDFERRKAEALRLLIKWGRYAAYGIGGYLAFVVFLIFAYRIINPPGSTLMLFRLLGGTAIERTWVPLERISPNLVRAVIVAEDGRFCEHWGIDVEAIRDAIRRSGDGTPRGASTISMQVTKNLFLWPSKSYVRKVIELPLTLLIEVVWPKRRILEIYLNVAEWGPGVFGAEAAARHHFRRPASRLGEREAALLAASLPNPVRRDAGDPGPRTSSKARVIQARMHVSGPVAACVTGNR